MRALDINGLLLKSRVRSLRLFGVKSASDAGCRMQDEYRRWMLDENRCRALDHLSPPGQDHCDIGPHDSGRNPARPPGTSSQSPLQGI
jgi:hypothetical protein